MNLHGPTEHENDRDGYRWSSKRVVGGELMGGTVYDLPAGERTFPYHYHHGIEEWLYVIAGAPVLREPAGSGPSHPATSSASPPARSAPTP